TCKVRGELNRIDPSGLNGTKARAGSASRISARWSECHSVDLHSGDTLALFSGQPSFQGLSQNRIVRISFDILNGTDGLTSTDLIDIDSRNLLRFVDRLVHVDGSALEPFGLYAHDIFGLLHVLDYTYIRCLAFDLGYIRGNLL